MCIVLTTSSERFSLWKCRIRPLVSLSALWFFSEACSTSKTPSIIPKPPFKAPVPLQIRLPPTNHRISKPHRSFLSRHSGVPLTHRSPSSGHSTMFPMRQVSSSPDYGNSPGRRVTLHHVSNLIVTLPPSPRALWYLEPGRSFSPRIWNTALTYCVIHHIMVRRDAPGSNASTMDRAMPRARLLWVD
jgi:hypothetical protein